MDLSNDYSDNNSSHSMSRQYFLRAYYVPVSVLRDILETTYLSLKIMK